MAARLVCETEKTRVIYDPAGRPPRLPGPLVITFPQRGYTAKGPSFWQDRALRQAGIAGLGLVCRSAPHWFCRSEMARLLPALLPIVARHRGERVATWGWSMGGMAALMHAGDLGADLTVALSPLYSPDPAIIGAFDQRHRPSFDPVLDAGSRVEARGLAPVTLLIYDPLKRRDREHGERIEALSPTVRRVVATGSGHGSFGLAAATADGARQLAHLIAHGPLDRLASELRRLIRSQRPHCAHYHQKVGASLAARGRLLPALTLARRAVALDPDQTGHRDLLHAVEAALTAAAPA